MFGTWCMGTQIILTGILHIKRVCTIPIHHVKTCRLSLLLTSGSKVVGAKVRALASNQCGLGSNPGGGTKCDLSFLLVFALRISLGDSLSLSTFPHSSSIRNGNGNQTTESIFTFIIY